MDAYLEVAIESAKEAGRIMQEYLETAKVEFKAHNNPVTEADRAAERAVVDLIHKHFSGHSFLCEEADKKDSTDAAHLWIVDPIDGTNNYSRKIPHFCCSIAYAEKGEVLLGVIYDPCRDELFHAIRGKGAYLNNKKIEVSEIPGLFQSVITTGFYYDQGELMEKTLAGIHSLFKNKITGIRRLGSAALDLAWTACGRLDGYFEYNLSPWDFAAGMLILREAGGQCFDRYGNEMTLEGIGVLASNGKIQKEFVELLKWK